jgi:2,5-diamino-6-(ribosylamino)-4(3H)-pyrimidinone 5'-phosphate reductase
MSHDRPYFTCLMSSTLDGRIDVDRMGRADSGNVFEKIADTLPNDGWIVGRVTMGEILKGKLYRKRGGRFVVPKGDFVAPHSARTYAISIDPAGKLAYPAGGMIDTEHAIAVLTEKVGADYLEFLRARGVSYLIGGRSEIDLPRVAKKLKSLFGVRRLTVSGGGHVNGAFLRAGLIDELDLILFPAVDGLSDTPAWAEAQMGPPSLFRFVSVKKMSGGRLLLRYRRKK